jgi:hypothetical protein
MMNGAKFMLEAEPEWRFFDHLKLVHTRRTPMLAEFKIVPLRGIKLKAIADAAAKVCPRSFLLLSHSRFELMNVTARLPIRRRAASAEMPLASFLLLLAIACMVLPQAQATRAATTGPAQDRSCCLRLPLRLCRAPSAVLP